MTHDAVEIELDVPGATTAGRERIEVTVREPATSLVAMSGGQELAGLSHMSEAYGRSVLADIRPGSLIARRSWDTSAATMADPLVLYSTYSWLAYKINEMYVRRSALRLVHSVL